jgi:hypothetical protein
MGAIAKILGEELAKLLLKYLLNTNQAFQQYILSTKDFLLNWL